jgi:uncharacterized membrane protein YagU involved in acid resistance
LTYALTFHGLRGVKLIRIPQAIASGLLGVKSFQGGLATAALGVGLHFVIALGAATVFYAASRKLAFLTERALVFGVLYGAAIYFFMNFIVLPLSAAPRFKHTTVSVTSDFAVHLFLIGLPIALSARRYAR